MQKLFKKLKAIWMKTLPTLTKLEILLSYQYTLKRKINAVKTLEDKILEQEEDPATMEAILTESMKLCIIKYV